MRATSTELDQAIATVEVRPKLRCVSEERGVFRFEVYRQGRKIDQWEAPNLVTNQGLNYLRDVSVLEGTAITSWFVLLTDATPTIAAGDTYASHAGWAEIEDYDEATRQAWTGVATGTAGEATNAAAVAEFTIAEGGATVGGAALVGGGTDADTKGDTAGGGTLLCAAALTGGDRELQESDVLKITYIRRSQRPA